MPLLISTALFFTPGAVNADSYLLLVSGLGGDQRFVDAFFETASTLYDAAIDAGIEPERLHFLAEDPERDVDRIRAKSNRENVLHALGELAHASTDDDQIWIVLIGHGSFRDGSTRINLPGPDLTDQDFSMELKRFAGRTVVLVNTSSSSGGFLQTLAGPDRVIVTATKSPSQRNETRFGPHFADAFADLRADENKDERVSLLEAFRYATREVSRYYETEKLLVTEQALLDDNGDGHGTAEPDPLGGEDGSMDGRLAAELHLGSRPGEAEGGDEGLARRRAELSRRLVELRRQKGSLGEEVYNAELERLLVEIAQIDQQIKTDTELPQSGHSESGRPESERRQFERPQSELHRWQGHQ